MSITIRDFLCSPQRCSRGLEENEWRDCYRSGEHTLELAHKVMKRNENQYIKLPFDDYAEAEALGARVERKRELPQIEYNSNHENTHENTHYNAFALTENEPTKTVLEAIRFGNKQPMLLQIQAPFSVLAYILEPMNLYKRVRKDPEGVEEILDLVGQAQIEYIKAALQLGVKIISLADPCASLELLGEKNYRLFAATPLFQMLQQLEPFVRGAVIHLCPRCSYPMEQIGFLKSQVKQMEYSNLFSVLFDQTEDPSVRFTGHQCIHEVCTNQIYQFSLKVQE